MTRVATSYNNFSRAKIDHSMMGRFDLPIYNTGADVYDNFISNFKGNAIYRMGFESIYAFQDCEFIEFKFSNSQNYLCMFYANTIRFISFDINGNLGWVLDGGGGILEVITPYTLQECKELDYTQNADVMVIAHPNHEPRKLTRVSANSFTLATYTRTSDPFPTTYAASKAITAITKANPGVITSAAHGFATGDRIRIAAVVGMTQVNGLIVPITVINANSFSIPVNTTNYSTYTSGGTAEKVTSAANIYPSCVLFYKARLYFAASLAKITTVWASEAANYDVFTVPASPTDTSAFQFTIADIAQKIEWLFGGENSLLAGAADGIVTINGGSVGEAITAENFEANLTSAPGCSTTYPLAKDGLVFYVGLAKRNLYYFSYDLLTESFKAKDANFISYDVTYGDLAKVRFKKDRNDLIYATKANGDLLTINFEAEENIVGWHKHTTEGLFKTIGVITDNNGKPQLFALVLRNGVYYIEKQAEFVEFAERVQFFSGNKTADNNAYHRYVAEQLRQCNFLDNSLLFDNLKSNLITYSSGAGTITAASPVFSSADIGKHIVYQTATGYESGRFLITGYTSTTVVSVSVLQTPTSNTYTNWYLSFETVSGLSQYNGTEIAVVVDGGYLKREVVSGGVIALGSQYTSIVVGYPYKGLIKTFSLGFQVQGQNTQTTPKAVYNVGLRAVASVGGKFGTSPYDLSDIQELSQGDLNYLPPLPIDGTKYLDGFPDDNEKDKYLYIVQDDPGPLHITNVMVEANY